MNVICLSSNISLKIIMCNNKFLCNGELLVYYCVWFNLGFVEVCVFW